MAGTPGDDSGNSSGQRCQSGEALAEWRSSEQLENGTPSTSPPFWDTDDDDDCGPKPAELYGKYTWKIDKFSQINKRELRSNAFEVGGYKWYILIYPQGCDVCNHLSLFLCVANHDKLLPGWSHFAQFTIAVVNKDPKKSKYSDTLHRFWKKEHDWGWKKFMELSKVLDGFIDADTLIIKAQVQVIRERADRPFRCLDCQYRRELVRVYLTNVEQICRRYVEERRGKLGKLIEDKARWSSFCAFWLGIDQNARRRMSRDKMDSILKVVVKHFFIEKEVTSTLVMDSLYSGLKALEGQMKSKKARGKFFDAEEQSIPIVRAEKDTFVLVDDVLLLLERAAMEPLPPKDEKGPQIRTKDGGLGEDFSKDSIERDERRLTELGRRTIELFFLSHIFSKIEVAYQEAVALRRQEELIREEEAAWLAISEQKSKKEKKSKKKQGKQKRNNKKGKDKGRDEKPGVAVEDEPQPESRIDLVLERPGAVEDVSDMSDSIDCVPDILQPDSEDRDSSPVNWDTDTSEVHLPTEASGSGVGGLSAVQDEERKSPSVIDDSSSTCSTDSLPSVVMNGPYKGINSLPNHKSQKSPSKGRSQRGKGVSVTIGWAGNVHKHSSEALSEVGQASDVSGSCKVAESESEAVVNSLQDRIKWLEQHVMTKEEEVVCLQKKLTVKDEVNTETPSKQKTTEVLSSPQSPPKQKTTEVLSSPRSPPKQKTTEVLSSPQSPPKSPPSTIKSKSDSKTTDPVFVRKLSRDIPQRTHKAATPISSAETTLAPKPYVRTAATPKPTEKPTTQQIPVPPEKPTMPVPPEKPTSQQLPVTTETSSTQQVPVVTEKAITQQVPVMSRPVTDPVNSGLKLAAPFVSMVQTTPLLSRSVSAAGRLGPDPSPAIHNNVPQSYRNAMMGSSSSVAATSAGFTQPPNSSPSYSQSPILVSAPIFLPQSSERMDSSPIRPSVSYGMMNHEVLQSGPQWMESPQRGDDGSRSINSDSSSLFSDMRNFNLYKPASTSGRLAPGVMADEFPHLDIINDLLDDEQGVFLRAAQFNPGFQNYGNAPHHLNRQFSFPGDIGMMSDVGPSTSSCRRFERTRSYHDEELQRGYGSSGGGQFDFDLMRDINPRANNLQPYANGQIPNQWQVGGSDLSYLSSLRNTDGGDAYPYNIPDYSNLAYGVNGYTVYRPSSGH